MTRITYIFTDREVQETILNLITDFTSDSITLSVKEVSRELMSLRCGKHYHQNADRKLSIQIRSVFLSLGFTYVVIPSSSHKVGKYRLNLSEISKPNQFFQAVMSA